MTTWNQRQEAHVSDCELCRRQLASPQPFHGDLCHLNIAPGGDREDGPIIQCPHLVLGGSKQAMLCDRHLEDAARQYREWVARTAPLN